MFCLSYRLLLVCSLLLMVANFTFAKEDQNFILGQKYEKQNQYELALTHYLEAILSYESTNNKTELFLVHKTIAFMCFRWGALDKSLNYFEKALLIYKDESTAKVLDILIKATEVYKSLEQYAAAIKKLDRLIDYYLSQKMNVKLIETLSQKAFLYNLMQDNNQAKNVLSRTLPFTEIEDDIIFKLNVLNDLGFTLVKIGNNYTAEDILKDALDMANKYKDRKDILLIKINILSNLAILSQSSDNYSQGLDYINNALKLVQQDRYNKEYVDLANIASKMNIIIYDLVQAKLLNSLAIKKAKKLKYDEGLEIAYGLRHELYEKEGESKLALIAFQDYNRFKADLDQKRRKKDSERFNVNAVVSRIEQNKVLELETKRVKATEEKLKQEQKNKERIELERQRALISAQAAKVRSEQEAAKVKAEQAKVRAEQAKVKVQEEKVRAEQAKVEAAEAQRRAIAAEGARRSQELKNIQREKETAEKTRAKEIEIQKTRQTYFYIGTSLLVLVVILILGFLYVKQKDNKKLEQSNQQLEKQKDEIKNQNEALQQRELALQENATKLKSMNSELQVTLDDLQNTQSQLIEAERMASLGQLIAGVAHEVNTPLGAINASISNISESLKYTTEMMSKIHQLLDSDKRQLFMQLLDLIFIGSQFMSSREERTLRRKLTKSLSNVPDFQGDKRNIASSFVDMGIKIDDTDAFVHRFEPLLQDENNTQIIECAYHIAIQNKSSNNINVAVQKASKVVFALKNYSRQSDYHTLVETNILENIETVLTVYHNTLKHGVEVYKEFGDDIPYTYCYADELGQVWTNILTNAVHAINNEGRIDISVHKEDQNIIVKIRDYGTGMPDAIIKKIFNPFFTTKKAGEGTGLGLDIVKKIIDRHEGNISVESEENVGTCFTISIPIITAEQAAQREKSKQAA